MAGKNERDEVRSERKEQAMYAREDTQKAPGREIGADYIMKGTIATILDEADGTKAMFYQVDLQMVDLESNAKVWFGQKKIKKVIEKSEQFSKAPRNLLSPLVSRPTAHASTWWGVCVSAHVLTFLCSAALGGCTLSQSHYLLVDKRLLTSDYQEADAIIRQAEKDYGAKSRVLYGMDRGMTLQLAGEYEQSNRVLEEAEEEVDRLYTRTVRTETAAFMTNDNTLPYEGAL